MLGYLRRLASTGASYTASSVISKLLAVALLPVYTRHLTRADYGAAEVLLATVVALSIVFRLGIVEALLRFYYQEEEAVGDRRARLRAWRDDVVRAATSFLFIAVTVGALLVAALAGPLSEALLDRRDTDLLLITAGGLWVFTLYELMMALFRLDERARPYFVASIANVLITIALTVWLVVVEDEGARGLLFGNFGGSALVLGALLVIHRRRLALVPSRVRLGEMLRFGFPTMPAELSLYALNFVDRVALARLAGLAEAGLYALAVKFSQAVTVIVRGFNLAWPPLAYSIRDDDTARRAYSVIVTYYLLLAFTVVLALSLEARWIVRALAAPAFFESYKAVPLVATGVALYALYLVLAVSVQRTGRTGFNFPVTGTALAVNIALNLALIPPYGLVGAGIALVGAYVVMIALMYVVTRRVFPLELEWGRLARIVGIAAALFALGELALPTSGLDGFLLRGAVALAYLPLLYASGFFGDREREVMRRAVERARGAASAQPAQDLEALRSRADLMDEVHDPE
ncbi:MAG: lipopolysaccharide biosynthesis protein [Solirubrobacterales bacterium]